MGLSAGGDSVAVVAFAMLNIVASPACCDSAKSQANASGEPIEAESLLPRNVPARSSSSDDKGTTRLARWRRRQAAAVAGLTRDSSESLPVTFTESPLPA